jgi:hypothetical protein
MALYLDSLGYELFLVARDEAKLQTIVKKCQKAKYYIYDLKEEQNIYKLYDELKNENIDFLINNAGFGLFGYFDETSLERELEMINVNIVSVHILTKLFLKDMVKRNQGRILNVASSAGFYAGPYLSTYYATKNYCLKLSLALSEELKKRNINVHISVLCPGPVETEFNKVAGGHFNTKSLSSSYVAKYAIDKALRNKLMIIPSFKMKAAIFLSRFLPYKLLLKLVYRIQINKTK